MNRLKGSNGHIRFGGTTVTITREGIGGTLSRLPKATLAAALGREEPPRDRGFRGTIGGVRGHATCDPGCDGPRLTGTR